MFITVEQIQVKKGKQIGSGGFGFVYEGERTDGSLVALKQQMSISDHEKKILQALKGKQFEHIIQVFAFEEKGDGIFTIMELGVRIDLRNLQDKRNTCLQMANGVSQLNKLGFFHRDLKPDNFLIGKDSKIKLIDFGTAKQISKETQTNQKGTFLYMAPEVITGVDYDSSVDIWSLGMIFYEVITNETFFDKYNTEYLQQREITQISQHQINIKLENKEKNQKINKMQRELLQKMIVQKLDSEQKMINSITRISIDEVITELEQLKIFEQSQKQVQNYEREEDLYEILTSLKDLDEQIFNVIIEILNSQKISEIQGFLQKDDTLKQFNVNNQERQKFINVIRNINEHDFNRNDYSSDEYLNTKVELIKRIRDDKNIIQLLKFFVQLTSIDSKFIQCGSNSLNLLVEMKADLKNHNFENIRIKNTSLIGGNFVRCNLSGSEFDNVDISGMNVNRAQLFNCKWKNIKIHELNVHSSPIRSVCFSPDGTTLASGSYDNSIRLWDVKTGQQKSKLDGHSSCVKSVSFSPDGTTLASGSYDKSICLWDVKIGQQKSKLDGHSSGIISVCFSPDGTTLASGSYDKSIRLWDVQTGQQQSKLEGHTSYVMSVCFSPDGTTLASGSYDNSIRLWDVKTGQQKSKLDGHSGGVISICFSPNGTTLASGSADKSICLWDVKTVQQKSKLDGHSGGVISICFSPDGTTLASGSYDNSIRLWDVKIREEKSKLDGHTSSVHSVSFSPDGTTLASGSADKSIRLWEIKTGQYKSKLDGYNFGITSVCFSPDGTTLASRSYDKSIHLWDVQTGKKIQSTDKRYKDILAQFKTPLFQSNHLLESINTNITILIISQTPIFQAYGALVLQGEFVNYQGVDLRSLLKSKGSCILDCQQLLRTQGSYILESQLNLKQQKNGYCMVS